MPYVNESSLDAPTQHLQTVDGNGVIHDRGYFTSRYRSRQQLGYRNTVPPGTFNLTADRSRKLDEIVSLPWWQQRSYIQELTDLQDVESLDRRHRRRSWHPVNDRDYSELESSGCLGIWGWRRLPSHNWEVCEGGVRMHLMADTEFLSVSDARNAAAVLLRRSRPTVPGVNMGQWLGELASFSALFSFLRTIPRFSSAKQMQRYVGGTYLAGVFGWIPFTSDLVKACEAVINSSSVIDQFVRDASRTVHRKRSRIYTNDVFTRSGNFQTTGQNVQSSQYTDLGMNWRLISTPGQSQTRGRLLWEVTCSVRREIRSFAHWEYYIDDPDGILDRMNVYVQKAEYLLGRSTLSPDTLYELFPFSWLLDWFVDFGGLLAYQQSVITDGLVATRAGFVQETVCNGIVTCRGNTTYGNGPLYSYGKWSVPFSYRVQRRRPGNPYNLGPDWSGFSPQQWAILGALGLTWGVGYPRP